MPSRQLKRAERSIQTIRDQGELPPETADASESWLMSSGRSKGACPPSKAKGLLATRTR
jgi:hypothetical protein